MDLWAEIDGERWLDNPQLVIAGNPKRQRPKRKGKNLMATRRRAHRRGRKHNARRRRRNYYSTGMVANRPRRRHRRHRMNRRRHNAYARGGRIRRFFRRRHRRNTPRMMSLAGVQLPAVEDVLAVGAGFVLPPLLTSYLMTNVVPATWQTSRVTYYAVKAVSIIVPSMLVRRFVSQRAGNLMLIGGAATLVIDILKDSGVFGSLLGFQPMIGYYPASPMLGAYGPARVPRAAQLPAMVATTPSRLSPQERF
jgi:hypothetical protein